MMRLKFLTEIFCLPTAIAALFILGSCTEEENLKIPAEGIVVDLGWKFEDTPFWSDEFNLPDGSKPSPTRWSYDVGYTGWGNNEKQYYSKGDNVLIMDSVLTIEARRENREGAEFTSSRIITRGLGDFLYGRFEARMKLPAGKGTWPAFWMLPTYNSYGVWPKSGEIDIMEHVGKDMGNVLISLHTEKNNKGQSITSKVRVDKVDTEFHVYRVDWTPYAIRGFIDEKQCFEYTNKNTGFSEWPFNKRFYLLLNLAMGGDLGGQEVDDAFTSASFQIDYVRVYKMVN